MFCKVALSLFLLMVQQGEQSTLVTERLKMETDLDAESAMLVTSKLALTGSRPCIYEYEDLGLEVFSL